MAFNMSPGRDAPAPAAARPAPAAPAPAARPAAHGAATGGRNAAVSLSPMGAQQLLDAARAEASATTAGPLAQLASQIAAQNRQDTNASRAVQGYFQGLGGYVNNATSQVDANGNALQGNLSGLASGLQTQLGNIQSGQTGLQSAYTPQGDGDVGAAGQQALSSALAQNQLGATRDMSAVQVQGAQQASGYSDLMRALAGSFATQGQQDIRDINTAGQSALGNLNAKYSGDLGKNAGLVDSDLVKLRQQEITNQHYANQDTINESALGIKQQTANTTASNDTAKNKLTAANDAAKNGLAAQGLTLKQQQLTEKQQVDAARSAYQQGLLGVDRTKATAAQQAQLSLAAYRQAEINLKKAGGGATPLTANENNKILNDLGQAVAASRQLSKTQNAQTILSDLTSGNAQLTLQGGKYRTLSALPRPVVQAALEVMQSGSITHQTYAQLHQMGVRGLQFKVAAPVK